MRVLRLVFVALVVAGPAFGQTAAPVDPKAQAFFEFLMARRL